MPKKGQSVYPELNNRDFLWRKYKIEGLYMREIAKELKCSKHAVWQALKKFEIPSRFYHQELTDYNFLWKKYWEEKLTLSQIAAIFSCNHETLLRAFEKLNIPTRTMSEIKTGENNGMYGNHHSEETLQKIRDKIGTGKENRRYGVSFTEEHKRKIGIASRNCTDEKRKKLSECSKGERNPMFGMHSWNFGKITTEETKAKLSVVMKGKYLGKNNPMFGLTGKDSPNFGAHPTEETKALMSAAQKGEKNYNYKGGKKAAKARSSAKRDRELGFDILIPLNEGELFHHVTNKYVIGIPAEVHPKLSGGSSRKKHRTRVLQWLKTHDKKKYKLVLCILAKQPLNQDK